MELTNQTVSKYFILNGFSRNFQICVFLFVVFSLIYTLTMLGNSIIIFIIIISPQLHTPMYYFLCNLSFLDLCISSCAIPKVLFDLFSEERRISVLGCLMQMYTALFLGGMEGLLLAVMAYDRYIAICLPLRYTTIMNWTLCRCLTAIMMVVSFLVIFIPTVFKPLEFCKEKILDHFACEMLALQDIACNTFYYRISRFVASLFGLFFTFTFIVISYICIIVSILKIRSANVRLRAFSTCASHLIVVIMFLGTSMVLYMGQTRSSSTVKYASLNYGVITPVLNPLIYSLRNNEVKEAYRKLLPKVYVCC